MSIQVYAPFGDYFSFANVSRAISNELSRKRFDVTIFGINSFSPRYVDVIADVNFRNTADIGIVVGYPEIAPGWLSGHSFKILVTVCETDRIPPSWVDACNVCDLVVVPSKWCREAFIRSGVRTTVLIVQHGIYSDICNDARQTKAREGFLHVSGSLTFAARKGTTKLLRAYKRIVDEGLTKDTLFLQMPNVPGLRKVIEELDLVDDTFILSDDLGYGPWAMANELRGYRAVVQPSRAEGFGLVPLEARAVGTPAIITNDTGHTEHFAKDVDTQIRTVRPMTLLDTQSNPLGFAPLVTEDDVYDGLVRFLAAEEECVENAERWANTSARNWDWSSVLNTFVGEIKQVDKKKNGVTLGGSAGLRGTE